MPFIQRSCWDNEAVLNDVNAGSQYCDFSRTVPVRSSIKVAVSRLSHDSFLGMFGPIVSPLQANIAQLSLQASKQASNRTDYGGAGAGINFGNSEEHRSASLTQSHVFFLLNAELFFWVSCMGWLRQI